MQNNGTTIPQDLQDKYHRYQRIQYQKMADRAKLTRIVSNMAVLCAIALSGLAVASRGSTQKNLTAGAVGMVAIASGAQVSRAVGDRRTKNELDRVRQSFLMNLDRA